MNNGSARACVLYEARELWRNGFVTWDTETSGLDAEDQIIQWAVCSQDGTVLGEGHIQPTVPISAGAFAIHGISLDQLADAPTFVEVWPTLHPLLTQKTVVIYNADFDLGKLFSSAAAFGIVIPFDTIHTVCAMQVFAQFYGQVHKYYGTYTWQKLTTAISDLRLVVEGNAHDATHDARATALLIKKLAELAEQELAPGWHPPVLVQCADGCSMVKSCAEPDEVWYCHQHSLERGLFHRCPGCTRTIESPALGFLCDDLCPSCHKALQQEKMLLIGVWHWCPSCSHSVETADRETLCDSCTQHQAWKQQRAEENRRIQERMEQERREHRRAYAKAYRQRRKEREQENRRRAALGLPPLEVPQARPEDEQFTHHGHQFQRVKEDGGRVVFICLRCDTIWSKPPRCTCAGIKAYRTWFRIPPHLKTRTQLRKLWLAPAPNQKPEAVMEGSFDRYFLYNQQEGVSVERKQRNQKQGVTG